MVLAMRQFASEEPLGENEHSHRSKRNAQHRPAFRAAVRERGEYNTQNGNEHAVPAMELHCRIPAKPQAGMYPPEYGRDDGAARTAVNEHAYRRLQAGPSSLTDEELGQRGHQKQGNREMYRGGMQSLEHTDDAFLVHIGGLTRCFVVPAGSMSVARSSIR